MAEVVCAPTCELDAERLAALRRLLDRGFGGRLSEEDWEHALGGWHAWVEEAGAWLGHVAVVPRSLRVGDRSLSAGYVEAMTTDPDHRRRGHAARLMLAANDYIRAGYQLGALSDGSRIPGFYQRYGWLCWRGESYVDAPGGIRRTPEEDRSILVLRTHATADLDLAAPIVCDWRPGDVW